MGKRPLVSRFFDTAWAKRHEGLIDFLLLILYVIRQAFLFIVWAVKGFFGFLYFCLVMLALLVVGLGLYLMSFFTDPKSKRPQRIKGALKSGGSYDN